MIKLTDMARVAGLTAGAEILAKTMRPQDIAFNPDLDIFEIDDTLVQEIAQSMRDKGYDKSQPLVLWKEQGCVVDGRTRLKAALIAGIPEIPVIEIEFESLEDAIQYAFRRQAERRNLTQGEILEAAIRLGIKDRRDGTGREREKLAKDLGVSESTIKRARTVGNKGSKEDLEAIKKGDKSINQVYQGLRKKKEDTDEDGKEDRETDLEIPPPSHSFPLSSSLESSPEKGLGVLIDPLADTDADIITEETNEYPSGGSGDGTLSIGTLDATPEVKTGFNNNERENNQYNLESPGKENPESGFENTESDDTNDGNNSINYSDIGDSFQVRFLRSAVILLYENKQYSSIRLLINHFIRREKRPLFMEILPKEVNEMMLNNDGGVE